MQRNELAKFDLPDVPGVYLFKRGRKVLYVGKATSLRDRVSSYFDDDLIATRGPRIVDMATKADRIAYEPTPTVLEALVREAALIRQYRPSANSEGKDDKSFLYAAITREAIPRVLVLRGKDIDFKTKRSGDEQKLKALYGPFPSSAQLRAGLRLIQRIFPFFDTVRPVTAHGKQHRAQMEFNRQIKQYPRLPAQGDAFDAKSYRRTMRKIELFLAGRGKYLRNMLEKEMRNAAKKERFEDAARTRRELFALDHIQDVSLVRDERGERSEHPVGIRIEAYDTAHLSGTNAIGVLTVIEDGMPIKKDYRTFRIRGVNRNDDIASLGEILSRRLAHPEWPLPKAVVVDGGRPHKKAAERTLREAGFTIPVAAVVKDERHRPREIIGARFAGISETDAVLANSEAHRFSLARHRAARSRALRGKPETKRSGR